MDEAGVRRNPHLENYFKIITNFDKPEIKTQWFKLADNVVSKITRSKYNDLGKFLEFTNQFLTSGTLRKTTQRTWKVPKFNNYNYSFKIEDDKPFVLIDKTTLVASSKKDSISITETSGSYDILKEIWNGNNGKSDWKRGNWKEHKNKVNKNAFVVFNNYVIDFKKPGFKANVTLNFDRILSQPQKGSYTNQISAPSGGKFDYPRFESENKNLQLKNIVQGIDFTGGLGLYGSKIRIRGDSLVSATMLIKNDKGQEILKAKSRLYGLSSEREINSKDAEISLYFSNDSIYHPSLNIKYDLITKQLRLVRGDKASAKIAFMDYFHQMELSTDALEWNLKEDKISFRATSQMDEIPVKASSFNYFNPSLVAKYRKELGKDPFVILANWVESMGDFSISANDFASQIGGNLKVENIRSVIFDLVKDGFIYYDGLTQIIKIREKTRFYRDAFKREIDFDNIEITSISSGRNYEIDLKTKDLSMTGVEQLPISNAKQVAIFPADKKLVVNNNRTIKASGDMVASNVDVVGGKLRFTYDDFSIQLDSSKHLLFYFLNEDGKPMPIKSYINGAIGEIQVDLADNKSGNIKTDGYPKLRVDNKTKIFFESEKLADGAYGAEFFYFDADPFTIDDLSYISKEDLTFEGVMNYGNIFPNIEQTASLQKDFKIGFDNFYPQENISTYDGKAIFNGDINLTEKGLFPDGKLDFLTTTITSNELLYLPELVKGNAANFKMNADEINNVSFPEINIDDVNITWKPFVDSMEVIKPNGVIKAYNENVVIKGDLLLQSTGLSANGKFYNDDIEFETPLALLSDNSITADSSKLILQNKADKLQLLKIDTTRITFKPKENTAIIKPYNQQVLKLNEHRYSAISDAVHWNGNAQTITFNDNDFGTFISDVPVEDSLSINFKNAVLSLNDYSIKVSGVNEILIADAKILPSEETIRITLEDRVDSLKNATVILEPNHKITSAKIKLLSKDLYEGEGNYQYQVKGLPSQTVHLDMIKTKEDVEVGEKGKRIRSGFYTVSNANILPEQNFKLDPKMQFKGFVYLDSRNPFLSFEGFGKLELNSKIESQWFAFEEEINPSGITIDVLQPVGEYKDSLQVGLAYSAADYSLYPAFLSSKTSRKDFSVFDGRGIFNYNPEDKVFTTGDSSRIYNENLVGNLLTLSDDTQEIEGNGRVSFYKDLGLLKADIAGSFKHTITDSTTNFNDLVIGLKFNLEANIFSTIQKYLDDWASENKEINFPKSEFHKAIPHLFNEEKAKAVLNDYEGKEYFERPEDFNYELFFANVDMVWDTINRSFRSIGDFGLSYVGSKPINSLTGGYIEFAPRTSGDQINIYLEMPDPDTGGRAWMFFSYKKGIMEINCSKTELNQQIENVKTSKSVFTDKKTGKSYQFSLGSMNKKNNFVVRMRDSEPKEEEK